MQDAWKLGTPAVNLGLRGQRDYYFDDAVTKPQGVFGNAGTFPKRDIHACKRNPPPRFGAAYDVTGNGKTVAKTTFRNDNYNIGVDFTDQEPPAACSRPFTGGGTSTPTATTTGEVNLSLTGPDFVSTTGAANILVNQDLKQGKTYEDSASLEREVAANFSMRALYVFTSASRTTRCGECTATVQRLQHSDCAPGPGIRPGARDRPMMGWSRCMTTIPPATAATASW